MKCANMQPDLCVNSSTILSPSRREITGIYHHQPQHTMWSLVHHCEHSSQLVLSTGQRANFEWVVIMLQDRHADPLWRVCVWETHLWGGWKHIAHLYVLFCLKVKRTKGMLVKMTRVCLSTAVLFTFI